MKLEERMQINDLMKKKKITHEEAVVLYNRTRKLSEWQ